jgi:recombination protein RecA
MAGRKKKDNVATADSTDFDKLIEIAQKSFNCDIGKAGDSLFARVQEPTGIDLLDRKLLGGGYPRGNIHIITGPFGTGKTFICHSIVCEFQKKGYNCVWIDAERRYDQKWASKIGVDTDKLIMNRPTYGEQAIDLILFWLAKRVDLIIVDSMAVLSPLAEMKADMEQKSMGAQANLFTTAFRKIIPENKNTVLIMINQLRQSIGNRFNPGVVKKMPGGDAQYYDAASIIEITRRGWITEKGEDSDGGDEEKVAAKRRAVGFNMSCFTNKCDFFTPQQTCEIPFNFHTAKLDQTSAVVNLAVDEGIIGQGGAWYNYGEEKFMGKQAMIDWFNEDIARLEKLKEELS